MSEPKPEFDFKTQLNWGQRGEELFQKHYPRVLSAASDLTYDFTVESSGQKLELKTDSYNMEKTPNFFMERYSDIMRKTHGGPWRAERDGIDIFCYYFVRHNTWFEFRNIPELVSDLNKLTRDARMVYIKNKGWVSGGFLVPRDILSVHFTLYRFTTEDRTFKPDTEVIIDVNPIK